MLTLIHLLQHLGVPSGVAIGVVVAARKLLSGGFARAAARRGRIRGWDNGSDHARARDR